MAEKVKKIVVPKNKKISDFYIKTLENEHQMALELKTVDFIDEFFDLYGQREGKELYYEAYYLLRKSFFPRKYIYFVLYNRFKRVFRKQNIQQLQGLEGFFAKSTLNSAVAAFCKNKPYEDSPYSRCYRQERWSRIIKYRIIQFLGKIFQK